MDAALDLMRRMPPSVAEDSMACLIHIMPDYSAELLSRVDQPLQVAWDEEAGKEYLLCDYNRDGDSYRSPWTSKYDPPLDDGVQPPSRLKELEKNANEVFSAYRDQYYEGGVSSVYFWEPEEGNGFAGCFLVKKDGSRDSQGKRGLLESGLWDIIHVIEVGEEEEGVAHYTLTSTVMLSLLADELMIGSMQLAGNITRQVDATMDLKDGHISNMGRMVEEIEGKLRNSLDQVYFGKTKEVLMTIREPIGVMSATSSKGRNLQASLAGEMLRRNGL
eukprot:TRINITY_DN4643_c0_g2_i1.p1 TRINITY_DN4643_c0_g2~~TRINITY_DN4643_c0_g2_i1.p1  ORF type:complete len:298 (+),score=47.69 TRINITY_DN4643_c0_g2_i1:70-894(+)